MHEHDANYVDTPASQVSVQCVTCDGDGWRYVARAASIDGGRIISVGKQEACPTCRHSAPGVPSGRVNLATGPGARLRRVDRVVLPTDEWGPQPE
jgi:hypothetical protein